VEQASALYGAIGSLFSPILYSIIISYIKPEVFDWREFLRTDLVEDKTPTSTGSTSSPNISVAVLAESGDEKRLEKTSSWTIVESAPEQTLTLGRATALDDLVHPWDEATLGHLRRWYKIAWIFLIFIISITFVIWPMPLYRDYIFTRSFFSGWITVAIFWQFFALFAVVIYPVYDGRHEIAKSVRGVIGSLRQRF
jgi:hypothetical protein